MKIAVVVGSGALLVFSGCTHQQGTEIADLQNELAQKDNQIWQSSLTGFYEN